MKQFPLPWRLVFAAIAIPTLLWLRATGPLRRFVGRAPDSVRWLAAALVATVGVALAFAHTIPWLAVLVFELPLAFKLAFAAQPPELKRRLQEARDRARHHDQEDEV